MRRSPRILVRAALLALVACGGKTDLASISHEARAANGPDRADSQTGEEREHAADDAHVPPDEREGVPESWEPPVDDPDAGDIRGHDDGGPGDPGVTTHACRSEAVMGGVETVICTEWQGPSAADLFTLCSAPGTTYYAHACEREGAVGVCTFPESMGLVIRLVFFAEPDEQASACREAGGHFRAP